MHTHFSATLATSAFFSVLVMGTLWRLLSVNLAQSETPLLHCVGRAMAFQY